MASENNSRAHFCSGDFINVHVDSFTQGLIAITYSEGGRVYRGVLLAEQERSFPPGANEQRVLGSRSWPPVIGTDNCLSLKTTPCSIERYSLKNEGQSSQLTVFQPGSKRNSQNLTQHMPRVLRSREYVCRKCKRSFVLDDAKLAPTPPRLCTRGVADSDCSTSNTNKRLTIDSLVPNGVSDLQAIRNVTPPIMPKLESRLKVENNSVSNSHEAAALLVTSSPTSRRKRDRHARTNQSPSQAKKKRVIDGEERKRLPLSPSQSVPIELSCLTASPLLDDHVTSAENTLHTPRTPNSFIETPVSVSQLRKDRIKAQFGALNSRVSPSLHTSGRRQQSPRSLCKISKGEKLKKKNLSFDLIKELATDQADTKKSSNQPLQQTAVSGNSATPIEPLKPDGSSITRGKNGSVSLTANQCDFAVSAPTPLRDKSPGSAGDNNTASPKFGSSSNRRRSGCYEKPKHRWIRAERIRDTEEATKKLSNASQSVVITSGFEKRRKSVDVAGSELRPRSTLPIPLELPDDAGGTKTSELAPVSLIGNYESTIPPLPPPPPTVPETPVLPHIKIKINRSVALSKTRSKNSNSTDLEEYKVKVVTEIPIQELSKSTALEISACSPTSQKESPACIEIQKSPIQDTLISPDPDEVPILESTSENTNGRRFVRRHRMSDGVTVFRVGDIVWCKLTGWPFWPARVTSISHEKSVYTACVRWFAWDQVSYITCDKLWPFLQHYDKKLDKRKKRGAYKQAVELALTAAQARQQEAADKLSREDCESGSDDDGSGWVDEEIITHTSLPSIQDPDLFTSAVTPESCEASPMTLICHGKETVDPIGNKPAAAIRPATGKRGRLSGCKKQSKAMRNSKQAMEINLESKSALPSQSHNSMPNVVCDSGGQPPLSECLEMPQLKEGIETPCQILLQLEELVEHSTVDSSAEVPTPVSVVTNTAMVFSQLTTTTVQTLTSVAAPPTTIAHNGEVGFSYTRLLKSTLDHPTFSEDESEGEDTGRLIIDPSAALCAGTTICTSSGVQLPYLFPGPSSAPINYEPVTTSFLSSSPENEGYCTVFSQPRQGEIDFSVSSHNDSIISDPECFPLHAPIVPHASNPHASDTTWT